MRPPALAVGESAGPVPPLRGFGANSRQMAGDVRGEWGALLALGAVLEKECGADGKRDAAADLAVAWGRVALGGARLPELLALVAAYLRAPAQPDLGEIPRIATDAYRFWDLPGGHAYHPNGAADPPGKPARYENVTGGFVVRLEAPIAGVAGGRYTTWQMLQWSETADGPRLLPAADPICFPEGVADDTSCGELFLVILMGACVLYLRGDVMHVLQPGMPAWETRFHFSGFIAPQKDGRLLITTIDRQRGQESEHVMSFTILDLLSPTAAVTEHAYPNVELRAEALSVCWRDTADRPMDSEMVVMCAGGRPLLAIPLAADEADGKSRCVPILSNYNPRPGRGPLGDGALDMEWVTGTSLLTMIYRWGNLRVWDTSTRRVVYQHQLLPHDQVREDSNLSYDPATGIVTADSNLHEFAAHRLPSHLRPPPRCAASCHCSAAAHRPAAAASIAQLPTPAPPAPPAPTAPSAPSPAPR